MKEAGRKDTQAAHKAGQPVALDQVGGEVMPPARVAAAAEVTDMQLTGGRIGGHGQIAQAAAEPAACGRGAGLRVPPAEFASVGCALSS